MMLSNTQIGKLGDRLRSVNCDKSKIEICDLESLQEYRMYHKDSLIKVFNELSRISRNVHSNRIVSFRMKKIDTILSKLMRIQSMKLDRMGDIAGCRCIVHSEAAVYKIKEQLERKFHVKIKDMIKNPDEDGYKSLHLYVKSKNDDNSKSVEIQLRTFEQHHWATLVEVIDVVYDTKIKGGDNSIPELNRFLALYSQRTLLKDENKKELIELEAKNKIFAELSETFHSNIIKLRNEWLNFENSPSKENYLVFEVDQDSKSSSCSIFINYQEAEDFYFQKFKETNKDLLVTHLNIFDFKQLSIAYSNYILTNHEFIDEWIDLLVSYAERMVHKFEIEQLMKVSTNVMRILKAEVTKNETNKEQLDNDLIKKDIDVGKFLKLNEWLAERSKINLDRTNKMKRAAEQLSERLNKRLKRRKLFKRIIGSLD